MPTCNLYMKTSEIYRHIFSGLHIYCFYTIHAVPPFYLWYGGINDNIWQNTYIEKIYEYASERAWKFFAFSHSKTVISFNILLVLLILYLRNIYIFRSQITICMIHIINAVPCYYLWYMALYTNDSIPTKHWHWENLWICERARRILHFHILKLLFPSIFCWYFWYFFSKTCIFSGLKLQSAWYIYHQCSSLLLLNAL